MAKLTISDAARACRVARSTLQRAVNAGRLSLDPDHRVDTAELLRAGYTLHDARLAQDRRTRQEPLRDAAERSASTRQGAAGTAPSDAPLLLQTIAALERENALLRAALDAAGAREQEARETAHAARDERALLLQMLQEMQHRYDRLLEAPRSAPPVAPALLLPTARQPAAARGEIRRRILELLREHPEGLTPAQTRQVLGIEKRLVDTMRAMARDGLLRRVEQGRYSVA
jgi:hypothetical protein